MASGRPCFFKIRLKSFSAAALSSFDVITAYRGLAFMIDGEPEIAELVVDLRRYLIQMPNAT
jgi:hypothetical protein